MSDATRWRWMSMEARPVDMMPGSFSRIAMPKYAPRWKIGRMPHNVTLDDTVVVSDNQVSADLSGEVVILGMKAYRFSYSLPTA